MKRFVLIIALSGCCAVAFGQIAQGKGLLTGSLRYSKTGEIDARYSVGVGGGYFVSDRSAVGLSFSFGKGTFTALDFLGSVSETLSIQLFSRYYVELGDEGKFFFFIQPSVTHVKLSGSDYDGEDYEVQWNIVAVSPGFSFYPAPRVGIELSVAGLSYAISDNESSNTIDLDLSPASPTLSVTFLLGRE